MEDLTPYPREILDLIKQYMPLQILLLLSKTYYLNFHSRIRSVILPCNTEKYIRTTLNRDHSFVFDKILRENYQRWLQMKNYMYKNKTYSNYIYFIKAFCMENDSDKCYEAINCFMLELGLGKNLHKKNISRSIIYHHP
jgi:hypothetical protein